MIDNIRNCKECGKPFIQSGNNLICPSCFEKEQEEYNIVIKFLRNNPNKSIKEISENTNVSEKKIIKWIKEGKIKEVKDESIRCRKCGTIINSGVLCEKCANKMRNVILTTKQEENKTFFHSKDE